VARHVAVTVGSVDPPAAPAGWPTTETTGATGTLTSQTIDGYASNITYENLLIANTEPNFQIFGDSVTFINCRFQVNVAFYLAHNLTLTDCDLPGGIILGTSHDALIERCKFENYGPGDAIQFGSNGTGEAVCARTTIRDCYLYNGVPGEGAHQDAIQVRGSLDLWLDHNYVKMGPVHLPEYNAAIYLEPTFEYDNENVLIENNYFEGGGYTCYIAEADPSEGIGINSGIFRNNTIGPGEIGRFYDPNATLITGTGNVDENGNPLALHP
jgi:hypothetical protein